MNDQAAALAEIVQRLRAPSGPARVQWLFHSCVSAWSAARAADVTQQILEDLGWETPRVRADRWFEARVPADGSAPRPGGLGAAYVAGSERPWAVVAATDSTRIHGPRLVGNPAIIFVLDTMPSSLIKTYQQIKLLVEQRPDRAARWGAVFVSPADRGRQRLVTACRRHLAVDLVDLGLVPRAELGAGCEVNTRIDPAEGRGASIGAENWKTTTCSSGTLAAWRQVVSRGLYGL